ncbi:hypothetical protein L21SP5_02772 [Salinivirga cyanobacteriivorans]|uniref:SusE outer membrane protein domain-containing protein n=1 Tax=Salinivirga cyanobacteriivorans TaxID=1307839 RepID=A0A0S2I2H6_9BACT|nr:SusE domain-containing protein [Salinivirga cyanobacteriivorans]ALO16395.1 hypothetical protein L21SP5_02772 [Salinivirga cyanobacteriivorans]
MKHLKYIILAILGIGLLIACEEDFDDPVLQQVGEFTLNELNAGDFEPVLSDDIAEDTFATFVWTPVEYNVPTVNEYTIEVDTAGNNFENAVVVTTVTDTNEASVSVFNFNLALTGKLGFEPYLSADVEVRVASIAGETNPHKAYTNAISMNVTSYDPPFEPEKLIVYGSDDTEIGYLMPVDEQGTYEGYVYVEAANEIQFGDEARETILGNDGAAGPDDDVDLNDDLFEDQGYIAVDSGYYQVTVNTYDYNFDMYETHWGVIGSAMPDGWDSDIDMTYVPEDNVWTITQETADGEFKFRPNDLWDPLNYGDDGADGVPEEYGANIAISAGTWTITLDLSEYPYSYTVEEAK